MKDKLVNARYVGPPSTELFHDGHRTPLVPGETVCAIPASEAHLSDNWDPVGGKPKTDAKDAD